MFGILTTPVIHYVVESTSTTVKPV